MISKGIIVGSANQRRRRKKEANMSTRSIQLDLKLPQLQNLIKRDPESYKDDFVRQYRHFQSSLEIFELQPAADDKNFTELALFIASTCFCYPQESTDFTDRIVTLLKSRHETLNPEVRRVLVQSLMQLRAKNMISEIDLLSLLFSLLKCRDKQLRSQLLVYIQSDIKRANQKARNNKLNKALQNHIFGLISVNGGSYSSSGDGCDTAALMCVELCQELYRKQIWNDSKTVAILAEALFSPFPKVMVSAIKYFLGTNEKTGEDSDEEEESTSVNQLQFRARVTKKSRHNATKLEKAMKTVKKRERKDKKVEDFNFSALHLLNDPQGLAEKLFKRMTAKGDRVVNGVAEKELKFELKVMVMNLISRIIGIHKLILLNFYTFAIKYLKPHQKEVTAVMAACAQASHDMVPPDALEQVVRTIIDSFISDAYSGEVIAAGINAIREICSRCPLAMDAEIMSYVATFKSHRDKGASMAARAIISVFREIAPELLPKKDRGKVASMELAQGKNKLGQYGVQDVADGIDGADLLAAAGYADIQDDDEDEWNMDQESLKIKEDEDADGWTNIPSEDEPELDELDDGKKKYKVFYGMKFHKPEEDDEVEEDGQETVGNNDDLGDSDDESAIEDVEISGDELLSDSDSDDLDGSGEEDDDDIEEEEESVEIKGTQLITSSSGPKLETMRFLTPADFERMKRLKREHEASNIANPKTKKRMREENEELDSESEQAKKNEANNIVSTDKIIGWHKKRKMDREERLASVMEGRKDRPKFGSKKGKERTSITNKEKTKSKNFMMVVHKRSVVAKKKMSFRERQMRERKHIEHTKKQI